MSVIRMPASELPSASGTLAERPIVSLLIYAHDTQRTGSLALNTGTGRHVLYFENGRPCQADTTLPVGELSRVLLDLSLCNPQDVDAALACVGDGEALGHYLERQGQLVIGALATARVEQLRRRVRALATLPATTTFAFYFGRNMVPDGDTLPCSPCDPLPLIVDAIRVRPDALPIADVLRRLHDRTISLDPDAPIRELGFRLEQVVVDALEEQPRTVQDLIDADLTKPSVLMIALYALTVTRCLHLGGRKRSRPLHKSRHASSKRHDSYPAPRMSGFFERRSPFRIQRPKRAV